MRYETLVREGDGAVVCTRCEVADSFRTRALGLLGRDGLARGEGLRIVPASSVHTVGMRFAIDVVFLDGDGVVLRVADRVGRWRLVWCRGARAVLELAAGGAAGLNRGDRLAART